MSRRILIFAVLSAIATACGDSTVATAPTQPRALAAPPVVAEEDGAERIADAEPGVDEPCIAIERGITGESGRALHAAGADGPGEQADALHAALEPLGPDAVAHVAGLVGLDGTDAGVLAYKTALDGLDQVTVERCGFPVGAALFVLQEAMATSAFQCVSTAIDAETCEAEVLPFPDELPCFEALGGSWSAGADAGGAPWEAIDCTTGEPVSWSQSEAAWTTATAADAFQETGESIGE